MKVAEINKKNEWEKFIVENSPVSFFQSWNWGEVIRTVADKKIKFLNRLGLYDNHNNLLAVFNPVKITALRGTFIHIRHGPVFRDLKYATVKFLTNFLFSYAKTVNAQFVRCNPLIESTADNIQLFKKMNYIDAPIHRMDGEYCWVVDLDKDPEELLSNMRKTTRYLIRQAQKLDVVIKKSNNPDDIKDFLRLYRLTARRHGFVEHLGIREEFEILAKENCALLFQGFYQNKLLSSALIIFYGSQAIYHHSASIEQRIPVNYLLQWEAILEAKKRGSRVYNFWGIAPPERTRHPWHNLTMFKMGFGGRILEYMHAQDLPVNKISYSKTFLIESARKIIKGY